MTEFRTCSVKVSVVPIVGRLEYSDLGHSNFDEDIKWGKPADEYTQTECIYRAGMTTRVKSRFEAPRATSDRGVFKEHNVYLTLVTAVKKGWKLET
jgi:hypothetical protein